MKNIKMKRIALISAILAMLLLITGCSYAFPANNTSIPENVEFTGEVQVSDEDTLRKALKSKEDCTVVLSGDIVITEELTVNGNKKLSGGSIIMDRRRIGANESVLAVSKGAYLVLDGTTVDGNGVADCITVKAGGCFESLSGSLIYGYPYGLDVSGTVKINDIFIDEAMHTAVNVAIFGEVDMLGGTITNNLYGISVAEDARMDMADGVTMDNSFGSFIINYGDMDIAGGKYIGSHENAIENYGKMSIKGTEENPIEIANGTKSALNSKNKSTLIAENIKIYDMGWHGMCVEKGSTATLKNIHLENAVKSTLYINSSKVKMEDVTVIGGKLYAIYATQNADVEMYDVTVKDTQNRGIYIERSAVNMDGITVEGTEQNGIYTLGDGTTVHINNANISKTGTSGVGVSKGKVTITNSKIENTTKEGVAVLENGTVTIEGTTIRDNGNFAIGNYGGKVTAKNVQIYDTMNVSVKLTEGGNFSGDGLVIMNSAKQAISVEGGSSATVVNTEISGTKMAAVYVDRSTLTMKHSTVSNTASYGVAAKNNGKAILDYVDVHDPGEHGIAALDGYIVATNIRVYNSKRAGIYSEGANARINMNQIEVYNAGSCGFGFKGAQEITARNVRIEDATNEGVYVFNGANVKKLDNIIIRNPGSHGISVEGGATVSVVVDTKFNPENTTGNGVTILNPGKNGIRCSAATVSAQSVTIENAKGQGISVNKEGMVTVNGCAIDTTVQAAVYAEGAKLTLKNATIANSGTYAVAARDCSKEKEQVVTLDSVEITNPSEHGVGSLNGYVIASNIKITAPGRCGVYTEGAKSIINMNQVEVYNSGSCAFGFKGGQEITARNVTIENSKNEGIFVTSGAVVKNLDNVVIKNPGTYGINVEGNANVAITVNTKYNPENTKGNGVTIINAGKNGIRCVTATVSAKGVTIQNVKGQAISVEKEGKAVVDTCKIDTTEAAGVYVDNSTLSLKNADIANTGTYAIAAKNNGKAILEQIEVRNSGTHGIGALDGYIVASNIRVYNPKRAGIYSEGANARINMMQIEIHNAGTCGFGFNGALEITARDVRIENSTNEGIYAFNGANVKKLDDIIIKNPGSHGISVEGKATVSVVVDKNFNPENTTGNGVTVTNPGTNGLYIYGATLNAEGATITGAHDDGVAVNADGVVTLKNCVIDSPAVYGMDIGSTGTVKASNTTITNAGQRGVNSFGKLTLTPAGEKNQGLVIDGTTNHGVYLGASANVSGSGLIIRNTGNNGIFSEGADITVSNFVLENINNQGVQLKGGTVALSNINFKEVGQAVVYARNATKLTLDTGVIQAYGYGIATTDEAEVTVKNVTVEKGAKAGVYTTNALINAEKESTLELLSGTKLDGKGKTGDGINVVSSTTSVILNGVTFTNIAEGNADVYLKGANTTVKIASKLTSPVLIKPNVYTSGRLVAQKHGEISSADFVASTKQLQILPEDDQDWIVNEAGVMGRKVASVSFVNGTTTIYLTLEEALAAAAASEGVDTVSVLEDVTVAQTIVINDDVKLVSGKADGALTISGSGAIFQISTGKTLSVTGTESQKINVRSTGTDNAVFYNEGTLNLTNVAISGGKYGMNTRANTIANLTNVTVNGTANNALHIAGGTTVVTATNVTVTNAGNRGVELHGKLVLTPAAAGETALTVNTTAHHGVYLGASSASVEGSGLTINNAGNNGIFTEGGNLTISGLKIENTVAQGIQLKGGTVEISNFEIKGTTQAAVLVRNATNLTLRNGTINPKAIGIANQSGSNSTTLENVTVTGGSGTLVSVTKNTSMIFNGVTLNTSSADIAEVTLASGATIKLQKALTSSVTVKPAAYAVGTTIAEKSGSISDADFQASMALLIPMDTNWYVDGEGKLACSHVWTSAVTKEPTCTEAGVRTYTCSVCSGSYTEPVAATGHTVAHVGRVEPTPYAEGNIEYWHCTVCNVIWGDEGRINVIDPEDVILPKLVGMVAYVNGTYYTSLADAIAAANEAAGEDTVTVLTDITACPQLTVSDDMKLVSGKTDGALTISGSGGLFKVASGKTLTVTGTATEKITFTSTGTSTDVFYNEGTLNLTNVNINGGKNGVNNRANAIAKLTNVNIDGSDNNALHIAGGTAEVTVTNVSLTNSGNRGVELHGKLVLTPAAAGETALTVESAGDHGVYLGSSSASVEGSGLTIKNAGDNGIFTEGGNLTISGLKIENTVAQGIQLKGGTVEISNFEIKGTTQAAVLVRNATNLTLRNGTINPKAIGIANQSGSNSTTLENVTVTGGSGTLVSVTKNTSMIFNGVTLNASSADIAEVTLASGATIKLQKALTSSVTVKPGEYAAGTKIAEKSGSISDADFQASMTLLIPMDTKWIVDENGLLAKAACEHSWGQPVIVDASCGKDGSSIKTCSLCGETITEVLPATGNHSYTGAQTKDPTCEAAGIMTYTCSGCSDSYTESVAATGHTVQYVAATIPTLEMEGNLAHWACVNCDACWNDDQQTEPTTKAAVTLPKVEAGNVAYMNGVAYKTLAEAVDTANGLSETSTIYLLADKVPVSAQLKPTSNITITAMKAVTVEVAESVTGSVIYVTSGTLHITGASESAKITIAASTKSQSLVKNSGGIVSLTNVHLMGNTASTVAVSNGNCIQNEKGTLTAKSVTITDSKGDGIRVLAGATANLDNVTISRTGKYGVNVLGTLHIYNTVHANHALTVSNTADHGIRVEGTLVSHLNSVPAGTYAIKAENNKGRGVVAVNSGNITISHISVTNSGNCGMEFLSTSGGSVSDFKITTTQNAGVKKATGTVTLTNGSITTSACCIETSDANLTASNVTVQRTAEGEALNINGATSFEGITVTAAE